MNEEEVSVYQEFPFFFFFLREKKKTLRHTVCVIFPKEVWQATAIQKKIFPMLLNRKSFHQ